MLFLVVAWAVGAILSGFVASQKGRNPLGWGAFSFVFSPLIALIALAALPSLQTASSSAQRPSPADSDHSPAPSVRNASSSRPSYAIIVPIASQPRT